VLAQEFFELAGIEIREHFIAGGHNLRRRLLAGPVLAADFLLVGVAVKDFSKQCGQT